MNWEQLFSASTSKLKASLDETRAAVAHRGLKGSLNEIAFAEWLRPYLPGALETSAGEIIDSIGSRSKQVDVIVYDAVTTPRFLSRGGIDVLPVEPVFAVIEVKTHLNKAEIENAYLTEANLTKANLTKANLSRVHLAGANLTRARLPGANLPGADLSRADLSGADLSGANIQLAILVNAKCSDANIAGCRVYGISAWDLKLERAKQENLIITKFDHAEITVDNIEVAQFIHLLLHNEKIHNIIDTITSKAVLILGRFTPERKAILDALRDGLRQRNRTPIVFDFDGPSSKNTTDTVKLLAQMARYVIIDLSDPNSSPYELGVISMLGLKTTPVVPIIVSGQKNFPMLDDVLRERWMTELITYRDLNDLRALLDARIISIAESKVLELRGPQQE